MSAPDDKAGRAWLWPAAIVAVLVLHLAGWLAVVAIATRDPTLSVEPRYYDKAVRWDEAAAQRRQNEELGWSLQIDADPRAEPRGERRLTCRVLDRAGTPVTGAQVDLVVFHHARAAERQELRLAEESPGLYAARPRMARAGLWEARFTVRRGAETFTHVAVQEVGGSAGDPGPGPNNASAAAGSAAASGTDGRPTTGQRSWSSAPLSSATCRSSSLMIFSSSFSAASSATNSLSPA